MSTERYLRLVDFALWVLAATAIAVVASLALGLLVGGDLRTGKIVTFVVGVLLFGAGSIALQPSGPDLSGSVFDADDEPGGDGGPLSPGGMIGGSNAQGPGVAGDSPENPETRYEARLQTVGPLAENHLPFERRIGRGAKLFATSLLVLALSLAMEIAGVQV